MRNSFDPFGVLYTFKISVNYPFTGPKFGVDYISDKYTMIYSNLNASKKAPIIDGKQMKGVFYFVPAVGKLCCGISVCTV
jgi:hypothetical protein